MRLKVLQTKLNPDHKWWRFWEPLTYREHIGYISIEPADDPAMKPKLEYQPAVENPEQAVEADDTAFYDPDTEENIVITEPDFIPIKRAEAKREDRISRGEELHNL